METNAKLAPTEPRQLTKGEKRVGLTFNPSGREDVNKIKRAGADMIDYLEALGKEGTDPDFKRWISMAQTDIETGTMLGVKAATATATR